MSRRSRPVITIVDDRPKGNQSKSQRSRRNRGRIYRTSRMKLYKRQPLALQQHHFVERNTVQDVIQIDTEASAVGLFKSFTLDHCNNASSYKDLFEYYKIDKIVVTFKYKGEALPAYNTIPGSNQMMNEVNPLLYFKVDHNDIASDPLITMQQSMRTRTKVLTNNESEFTITLKPAIQAEAYKSAIATTYIPKWGQWLSTADGSVPHYGLKAYAIGYRDANFNPGKIQVETKTYFSCKNNE